MPMKVIILEDEQPALQQIRDLLLRYDNTIGIAATFDSVKDIVSWLRANPHPDLIFMDIQVADGLSFEVFEQVQVLSPVIFTTAYQEYAIRAFKVNSIDYLLKPLNLSELKAAMEKFSRHHRSGGEVPLIREEIIQSVRKMLEKSFKTRFVVKTGEHLRSIPTSEIHLFSSHDKITWLSTAENRNFIIDYSLDQVTQMIDGEQFFRINRQSVISRDAISDIVVYSSSRLKIKLKLANREPLIVSREKVNDFKSWLEG
jgi:two-component system, LytTR family, response regulator